MQPKEISSSEMTGAKEATNGLEKYSSSNENRGLAFSLLS
jgi:hypothetical protein